MKIAKGKDSFSTTQINELKRLISEKVSATPSEQKNIRNKIREIGFYYSDYNSKKTGYTVSDFESLIQSGIIKVDTNKITSELVKESPIDSATLTPSVYTTITSLLNEFKQNRFDPTVDNEACIPNTSGNYIICLKVNSKLPTTSIIPILTDFEGLKVIYTGIAGTSLRTRDYRQHFCGNNAGRSTLRKSLGVLFGYKKIPRDQKANNGKTKFNLENEQALSKWMKDNLVLYFLPTENFIYIETKLIKHFNPPLNLQGNLNSINYDFRRLLSSLRCI